MKGLLLKDAYVAWKNCKIYLLMVLVYAVLIFWTDDNMIFVGLPILIVGSVPMLLQSQDENCKWDVYAGSMPVTKRQLVSEKYIMGLLATLPATLFLMVVKAVSMAVAGNFQWNVLGMLAAAAGMMGFATSAVCLPLMFRLGAEKSRIVQLVLLGIAGAVCGYSMGFYEGETPAFVENGPLMVVLMVLPVVLYVGSWFLSVRFYEKREVR